MALQPDITEFELSSGDASMDYNLRFLKDFFDSSKSVSDSSEITSVRTSHGNGFNAQRFGLVSNTNGTTSFTIEPQVQGENWQVNFQYDSDDWANVFFDPQGNITDATTDPPTTSSTGNPEESTNFRGLNSVYASGDYTYVVEFDDALIVFITNTGNSNVPRISFIGRVFEPFFPSFEQGLGAVSPNRGNATEGHLQVKTDQWAPKDQIPVTTEFHQYMEWPGTGFNINVSMPVVANVNGPRPLGFIRYFFSTNIFRSIGDFATKPNLDETFCFMDEDKTGNGTTNIVIPWDESLIPVVQ